MLSQKWLELGSINQARVGGHIWKKSDLKYDFMGTINLISPFSSCAIAGFDPSGLDDVKLDDVDDTLDDIARGHSGVSQCLLVS